MPALDRGTFHNMIDSGEGGYFLPPSDPRNYLFDLSIQMAFDTSGKFHRRKPKVIGLWATHDVTGQVKVKMFDDLAYLVLSHTTRVKWK